MSQRFDRIQGEYVEIDPGAARNSALKALSRDLRAEIRKAEKKPVKEHTHENKGIKRDIRRLKKDIGESLVMVAETVESIEDDLNEKISKGVITLVDGGTF
jgi:hypothetical protein